jgi:hypothetical protein
MSITEGHGQINENAQKPVIFDTSGAPPARSARARSSAPATVEAAS